MAKAYRGMTQLLAGLVADLVCSMLTVLQLVFASSGSLVGVVANVLQVVASALMLVGLSSLRMLSLHFAYALRWRMAQFVTYLVLVVAAALPLSSVSPVLAGDRGLEAGASLTLASVAAWCLLSLFANRTMLRGAQDALHSLGSSQHEQERVRAASTLALISYSLLVISLVSVAGVVAVTDVHGDRTGIPLVLGGLLAFASLAISVVFALVVDVLVVMRMWALRAAYAKVMR